MIPVGLADPARAMRAADRLPIIMDLLTTAYDLVVVECGPADPDAIRRLVGSGTEVLVSVLEIRRRGCQPSDDEPAGKRLRCRDAGLSGRPHAATPAAFGAAGLRES